MSREIDKLIAQHVFESDMIKSKFFPDIFFGDRNNNGQSASGYSIHIEKAMEVVEKMAIHHKKYLSLHLKRVKNIDFYWEITHGEDWFVIGNESLPMAICLASLSILNVKIPEEK